MHITRTDYPKDSNPVTRRIFVSSQVLPEDVLHKYARQWNKFYRQHPKDSGSDHYPFFVVED